MLKVVSVWFLRGALPYYQTCVLSAWPLYSQVTVSGQQRHNFVFKPLLKPLHNVFVQNSFHGSASAKNSTTGTNSFSSDTTPPFLAAHLKMAHSRLSTGHDASFGHCCRGLVAKALRAAQPKNLGSIPALATVFLMGTRNANAHVEISAYIIHYVVSVNFTPPLLRTL